MIVKHNMLHNPLVKIENHNYRFFIKLNHFTCILHSGCGSLPVITFKDPPLAHGGYVFLEISSLQSHTTVFVGTGDEFEKTRCQVNLFHK